MTGRDLLKASLRLIGAIAPGESLSATEAVDGLATLNRMIDGWSNESLMIYSKVREEFTLTANDGVYSIGPSADFNTTRPISIEEATLEVTSGNPDYEIPLRIIKTSAEWAAISQKDSTNTYPECIFAEGTYPNETINLYPIPSEANKLVLYSKKPISTVATIDTSISYPPGYEEALIYNLALRLAPEYGRQVTEMVMMTAIESKASIKRVNHRQTLLRVDDGLLSNTGFNIMTGEA